MGSARSHCGWLTAIGCAAVFSACTTDHDQFAKTQANDPPDAGSGGQGHGGASSNTTAASTGVAGTFGGSSMIDQFDYSEDGRTALTVLHGQVDAERIAICFAEFTGQGAPRPVGDPFPAGGLGFGEYATTEAPGGLALETDGIQPIVLSGDLDLLEGEDCETVLSSVTWVEPVASPSDGAAGAAGASSVEPSLSAATLPALAAGSLASGRHHLLAVIGCMAPPPSAEDETAYADHLDSCGAGFSPQRASLTALLLSPSRAVDSGKLGLSVWHAALATEPVDVEVKPSPFDPQITLGLASRLAIGELYPPRPNLGYSADAYGVDAGGTVHLYTGGSRQLQLSWSDMSEQAGDDSLPVDGDSYLLVLLGARAGLSSLDGYNEAALSLVPVRAD